MAEASGTSSGASGPSESQEIELSSDSESAIVSGACTPVESSSTSADSGRVITSLLDRLKSPEPSHLARKRTITGNMPPVGKKRGKGATAGDPKSVPPAERVKAYPNEPLTVSNKKLFCSGCREQLSLKKSSIELHLKSLKHVKGKERLASKQRRQLDIAESLKRYDDEVHPSGEMLPVSTRV